MLTRPPSTIPFLSLLLLSTVAQSFAQTVTSGAALTRIEGIEPTQGVAYVRILQEGKLLSPTSDMAEDPPRLIAQCTRSNTGLLRFELRMTFGGISDTNYYLPWKKSSPGHVSPPPPEKTEVTFEFLGYTHVKPMKRQWEIERKPAGEFLYLAPAFHSHNLEETNVYMRYLAALPVLRLIRGSLIAEFESAAWLAAVEQDPLCKAAGA